MPDSALFYALATAYPAGEPEAEQVVERGGVTPGRRWRWLRPLADRYVQAMAGGARPRHRDGVQFLREDRGYHSYRKTPGTREPSAVRTGCWPHNPANAAWP
jgi:hypothetical protein